MNALSLPPRLQPHPQHAAAVATAQDLNCLLLAGRINWLTAVYRCPSSALHILNVPSFLLEDVEQ